MFEGHLILKDKLCEPVYEVYSEDPLVAARG